MHEVTLAVAVMGSPTEVGGYYRVGHQVSTRFQATRSTDCLLLLPGWVGLFGL